MKKLLFIALLSLVLFSCKKDEQVPATTYQVVNNAEKYSSTITYFDGTLWEITVFCYDAAGDVVRQDNIKSVKYGGEKSDKIEVTDNIVKLVVSFKFLPSESPYYSLDNNYRQYTVTKFAITPGTNNEIVLDSKTMLKKTLSLATDQNILSKSIEKFVIH